MSGQSITDRVMAAKHSLAGQGLAKSVHKATTEEIMGPKKKHLDCEFSRLCFDCSWPDNHTVTCIHDYAFHMSQFR